MRVRLPNLVLVSAILLVFTLFAKPSMAQTAEQQRICANSFGNPIQIISACSALIQAQRLPNGKPLTPKMLAELHFNRGIAYGVINDFERAIADYEKTLFVHARARRTYYQKSDQILAWLRYLKGLRMMNTTIRTGRAPPSMLSGLSSSALPRNSRRFHALPNSNAPSRTIRGPCDFSRAPKTASIA